ncbi:TAXI family TRAP transporter solute-binding subunit [Halanaeroarchaeum sulfurireducens]|uniref:C4-dicarboxylate ABC transporter substrate-binding protein n=1 Tax=Halanaeroarchaeum sulfurireducens TaxID=1604004 RepID=A0A0N9N3A3_9EURY|nr:TAXI family TRAP transporter solute-binding subunit [Halanaeroarchaeum sulfurireducens]ALG81530.1 C4-dicarboxylate ABC transporter substrate-binding protein [Halanaeroarchaeum sulfurireducens]
MEDLANRRTFLKATGVAGIAALAGCSGGDGDSEDGGDTTTDGDGGERIAWHAGGTGGTYYPLSGEFKTIVEANTPHSLQVQSTGASVENVGSLGNGSADFALIQNDIAYFAKNGEGLEEFEGASIPNLMGVATLYPETIHVITRPDAGVESLSDLEGKSVNTGDLGSGTQVNALQILEAVGLTTDDFDEQNASFSTAADQIRDGDVDASFVVGGWPVGAIEELATTSNINLLAIEGDTLQTVLDSASWFAEDTVPAGTYNGVDEDVTTVSVQAMIATREEYSEDIVVSVTAAIFDNTDELSIKPDFISADSAQDGMSIELHPGAAAYFE